LTHLALAKVEVIKAAMNVVITSVEILMAETDSEVKIRETTELSLEMEIKMPFKF
jgi:hypothetical protein